MDNLHEGKKGYISSTTNKLLVLLWFQNFPCQLVLITLNSQSRFMLNCFLNAFDEYVSMLSKQVPGMDNCCSNSMRMCGTPMGLHSENSNCK